MKAIVMVSGGCMIAGLITHKRVTTHPSLVAPKPSSLLEGGTKTESWCRASSGTQLCASGIVHRCSYADRSKLHCSSTNRVIMFARSVEFHTLQNAITPPPIIILQYCSSISTTMITAQSSLHEWQRTNIVIINFKIVRKDLHCLHS